MSFCLWLTGLPGSGKSTILNELCRMLIDEGIETVTLSLDQIRKVLTPEPRYTREERDIVYRSLVMMALLLVERGGKNVIIDATGNRRHFRQLARELIRDFAEVYVKCPLKTCQSREALRQGQMVQRDLYRKAIDGRLTGRLPGITAPYEESENPELEVRSDVLPPYESARKIMDYVRSRWMI